MNLTEHKNEARKAAFGRRKTADVTVTECANQYLIDAVRLVKGAIVSGFCPIRTEIDPRAGLA